MVSSSAQVEIPSIHVPFAAAVLVGGEFFSRTPFPTIFPQFKILDDIPQVQKDIKELSKSYLVGKILGALVDLCTIVSRTKAYYKFVKGNTEYLEMRNKWIMVGFANPNYCFWCGVNDFGMSKVSYLLFILEA